MADGPVDQRPRGLGAGAAALLAAVAVVGRALLLGLALDRGGGAPDPVNFTGALLLPPLVALWIGLALFRRELPVREALGLRRPAPRDAVLALLLGLALGVVVDELVRLTFLAAPLDAEERALARELGAQALGSSGLAFGLALSLALGPLVDELLFRGLLVRGLAERLPAALAVAVVAVLYALSHAPRMQPAKLVEGLVLGAAALGARSTWIAVLGAVGVAATMLGVRLASLWPELDGERVVQVPAAAVVLGALVAAASLAAIVRRPRA